MRRPVFLIRAGHRRADESPCPFRATFTVFPADRNQFVFNPGSVFVEGLPGWIYLDRRKEVKRYAQVFQNLQIAAIEIAGDGPGWIKSSLSVGNGDCVEVADPGGGSMRWLDRLVIELAQTCRDALGSWNRTCQLCLMILALALGVGFVLWVTHH